jgi:tRNA A37 threonylcarbamoyladenosine dehydratase
MAVNPLFQRLALVTGEAAIGALSRAQVLLFGLGGVGSWCAEALVRSGVGAVTIVDSDAVCVTNVNRQVEATVHTLGRLKTRALGERLRELNPRCTIEERPLTFSADNAAAFPFSPSVYVVDAIDTLSHKLDLIEAAAKAGAPLVSCMGMAQKLDPTAIRVADIWDTTGCPLARLLRKGLRDRGFEGHFPAVFSAEQLPRHAVEGVACGSSDCLCSGKTEGRDFCEGKMVINGSFVGVTATAGMVLASWVVRDIVTAVPGAGHPSP